ncbi:DUF411 domain-containing protein [Thioalkalivibrio thiocyanodenitrificans]|uniref:DUF411 domain-containing protein n=1 Tax=Thioalkalivibrio thiocyanodenitrificans TaxID=243063 RepID=UPI0003789236|nr:DUF411 domain-containing protein [Thioalkalivibrio thiocyanodenitrificans]
MSKARSARTHARHFSPQAKGLIGAMLIAGALGVGAIKTTQAADMIVYKSPTCGCCGGWIDHVREAGFSVKENNTFDLQPIKAEHGVAARYQSCHTAVIGDYVVEGHVPADIISRLVAESPDIRGLALPGMPMGSPGMEGPYSERYEVLAINHDGSTYVFERR